MRDGINAFIETNFKIRYIFEDDSHNADEPDDPLFSLMSLERTHPGNLYDLDVIYQYEESNPRVERVGEPRCD